ncbi:MAG: DNA-binding response regulator, partial [Lactococcus sp.]|nr:DNA-binding response regulator [Lactococcus sp.]
MKKISLMLVDDHEMVRLGLSSYLNMQEDLEVVAEAVDGLDGV